METITIQVQLSKHTHGRFKSACALANQSIKDALVELVHYYIDNQIEDLKHEKK